MTAARFRTASIAALETIRTSQVRKPLRPSKSSRPENALSSPSWTASSRSLARCRASGRRRGRRPRGGGETVLRRPGGSPDARALPGSRRRAPRLRPGSVPRAYTYLITEDVRRLHFIRGRGARPGKGKGKGKEKEKEKEKEKAKEKGKAKTERKRKREPRTRLGCGHSGCQGSGLRPHVRGPTATHAIGKPTPCAPKEGSGSACEIAWPRLWASGQRRRGRTRPISGSSGKKPDRGERGKSADPVRGRGKNRPVVPGKKIRSDPDPSATSFERAPRDLARTIERP